MLNFPKLKASSCIAALLIASSASADVSASQVWDEWQAMLSAMGEDSVSFTGGTETGGDLTVNGLKMTIVGEDNFQAVADIGTMVFDGQGDGTVIVTMPESYPLVMTGDEGQSITMTITQTGMQIIASGEPSNINYAVAADRYGIIMDEFNDPSGATIGDVRFLMNNVVGNYAVKTGEMRDIDYAIQTSSMDLLIDVKDPESDGMFLMSGKMNDLTLAASASLPLVFDAENPELMFASGLSGQGTYTIGSADYIFDFKDGSDAAQGSASIGSGFVEGGLVNDTLAYNTAFKDLVVNLTVPDFPFPINVSMADYGIGLTMPTAPTDAPADVGLKIDLVDLSVNDEIWMMGDPTGALPHDPVTLQLDLTGKAKLLMDIMNPEDAQSMALGENPAELYELALNNLLLRAAGAEVTGTGAFTFDNSDLETFDGMPRPTGAVTVNVNGANKLIDTLVTMGLLPEQQASMGRMMMGMFARTVGDDQLSSTLEINAEGHVLANGQRIQ